MQEVFLEIGGIPLSVTAPRLTLQRALFPFLSRKNPQLSARILFSDPPHFKRKDLFYRNGKTYQFYRIPQGFLIQTDPHALAREIRMSYPRPIVDSIPKALLLDSSFKEVKIFLGSEKEKELPFHLMWLYLQLLLAHLLLLKRVGFFLHAAGVSYQGRGYLFVGPGGAGKSTLSKLLYQDRTISVLGDDLMVVCKRKGGPRIYGTPPCEPFPFFSLTEGTPLRGIFFLAHGKKNQLRRLALQESLRRFLLEVPPISWALEADSFLAEFVLTLCSSFPIYELSFVPDARIVSFLKKSTRGKRAV